MFIYLFIYLLFVYLFFQQAEVLDNLAYLMPGLG